MSIREEDRATILVVEDDNSVRRAISRMLRSHGYEVIEASDGEDAIVAAGEFRAPIHLVVSDVLMPRLGGLGLFEELHAWYPQIRFLLISGDPSVAERFRHLGEDRTRFLAKPFMYDQLVESVDALLA